MGTESQEATVARLDERMEGVQREMSQLVSTVQTLTEAVNTLTREHARISTVEIQVTALLKGQEALWTELRRVDEKVDTHKSESARQGRSDLFELIKLGLTAAASVGATLLFKGGGHG
jgi:uncharacterized protein YoxC